jgi:hypothetical protein
MYIQLVEYVGVVHLSPTLPFALRYSSGHVLEHKAEEKRLQTRAEIKKLATFLSELRTPHSTTVCWSLRSMPDYVRIQGSAEGHHCRRQGKEI